MTVLIVTSRQDSHARIIASAARAVTGSKVVRWLTDDPFARSRVSCAPAIEGAVSFKLSGIGLEVSDADLKTVWFRRPALPYVANVPVAESKVLQNELRAFLSGFFSWLENRGLWVNPSSAKLRSESKLLQLHLAATSGLIVPRTIMTNDVAEVLAFMVKARCEHLIYKTFTPCAWDTETGRSVVYATKVTAGDVADERVANSAAIWQVPVPKAFEIRVTIFGDTCVAAKIDSQEEDSSRDDWRAGDPSLVKVTPYLLPTEVYNRCRQLMRDLGIVFGAFDFIVTPGGEYVFLEVNEGGQFLWVEERCPEIRMLDAFLAFCLSGDKDFKYVEPRRPLFLGDVLKDPCFLEMSADDDEWTQRHGESAKDGVAVTSV